MKPIVSSSADRPQEACAELKVGVRSVPYLADHGFQDMIVLPGSFYTDAALRVEHDLCHRVTCVVRNMTFLNPIVLSEEDTLLQVEVRDHDNGRVEYTFYEAGEKDAGARSAARQPAAKLETERPLTPSLSASTTPLPTLSSPSEGEERVAAVRPSDTLSPIGGEGRGEGEGFMGRESGRGVGANAFAIEAFQAKAQAVIHSEQFYKSLRENGNEYGPLFQNVSAIWRADDQVLGRISVPHLHRQTGAHHLHPSLLDSITQLLASFIMEKGKTFVLQAIEKLEILNLNFPETLWGHATLVAQNTPHAVRPHEPCPLTPSLSPDGGEGVRRTDEGVVQGAKVRNPGSWNSQEDIERGLLGNIRVFDESGKLYLELSGVAFTLLERVDTADEKPAANLVIAANFTAEPLEDPLNFWGDHFGISVRTEFAPYNQVFQQLLGAGSAFCKNGEGVNIILLGLEEWANPSLQRKVKGTQGENSPNQDFALWAPEAPHPAFDHPLPDRGRGQGEGASGDKRELRPPTMDAHRGHELQQPEREAPASHDGGSSRGAGAPRSNPVHGELSGTRLDKERANECFGNRARYVLPNGLEIVHLNQYETDYVYKEIFEDRCYLRHGIRLRDGDTVVDIGANIGLFSLFVMSRCKAPKVYAFEPAPVAYDLLQANCRAHGSQVRAVNAGVSDKAGTATFTFYEKSSVFSSFHADEAEDREAIQAVVRNMLNGEAGGESVDEYVNELTADRLRRRTCECQLTCVSDIIREHQIDTIDLLKIDAEKSELEILKGIADSDWPKISQIVMEIHDRSGAAVKRIEEWLGEKGFRCAVEHEKLLEHSGLFNLYATRDTNSKPLTPSLSPSDGERETGSGAMTPSPLKGERAGVRGESDRNRSEACKTFGPELETPHPSPLIPLPFEGRGKSTSSIAGLQKTARDFCTALRSFAKQTTPPLVLCICPRSPAAEVDLELKAALNEAEQTLLSEAGTIPNVHTISSASLLQRYPIQDYYDPHGHDLGHIPYTPECYSAIGTALFRTIFNLRRRPSKVIVLDCDNTLWKGVCGEDGPRGIEIPPPFRVLQEFMIQQMNAGVLLCLCSKNNEQDVLDVFAQRTDMPLKREHLVGWRINWNSKSENLKALAQELNLGLDSFIFVDDNPVECADVRINCPGVLTLQLPANTESFASFLNHIWAFDHFVSTEEDQKRTRMYQEGVKRQQFREQALSLKDYLNGLQLDVEITEATDDQLARVSQLTFRTNQFNFTTLRRTEKEVRDFLNRDDTTCLVVHVVDRFGDYGLVGVVMYEACTDRFKVDTLLLSCRVLGRGVEHALVSHLGQLAVSEGKQFVELTCPPTEKNQPAREFLTSIGEPYRNNGGTTWTFPAKSLASVEYDPDKAASNEPELKPTVDSERLPPNRAWGFDAADLSERLQQIGEEWCDTNRLGKAIEEYRLAKESSHEPLTPALSPSDGERGNALETALLNIWRKVLGRPRIGVNDNFFEAGGTSLRAVQVIATIKKELKRTLSIVSLFECPTVALLAAKMGATADEVPVRTATTGAALRGQQRRYKTNRRKAAPQP